MASLGNTEMILGDQNWQHCVESFRQVTQKARLPINKAYEQRGTPSSCEAIFFPLEGSKSTLYL